MTNTMIHSFAVIKGTLAFCGVIASATGLGVLADAISDGTPITLGGALSVGGVVVLGAWYLSNRLTSIDDRLTQIERKIENARSREMQGGNK